MPLSDNWQCSLMMKSVKALIINKCDILETVGVGGGGRGLLALHKPILFAYLWFHAASRAIYI